MHALSHTRLPSKRNEQYFTYDIRKIYNFTHYPTVPIPNYPSVTRNIHYYQLILSQGISTLLMVSLIIKLITSYLRTEKECRKLSIDSVLILDFLYGILKIIDMIHDILFCSDIQVFRSSI